MRLLLAVLLTIPLAAQEASSEPAQAAAAEPRFTLEVGNRWTSTLSGNRDVYRSLVDLGDGPKVLGLDLSLTRPGGGVLDQLEAHATGWGGDPYSTAWARARRGNLYDFTADYRNMVYFNALPSFANPGVDRGIVAAISPTPPANSAVLFAGSQSTYNLHRRMLDTRLDLFPKSRIIPFLAYARDWGKGDGVTDFVADFNEYPVRNLLRDKTDHYRGGVRLQFNRAGATLEQGGTAFKDDQRVYLPASNNPGNRTTPFLGQPLNLTSLQQAYRARGDSLYSKALVSANPFSWINLSGQFLYSLPSSDVAMSQDNTGNFFSSSAFAFFTGERLLASTQSKQPHTSGSFTAELRPHRRLRVFESVMTDRFHTTSTLALLTDALSPGGSTTEGPAGLERLVLNYNRQEVNVIVDVAGGLTLRGGHRYVWGDAVTRAAALSQTGTQRSAENRMHVGLAGLTYRPAQRLSLYFDYETGSADKNYFRTSLQDYHRARVRGRFQVSSSLSLTANAAQLHNENPSPASPYEFKSWSGSLGAFWTPGGGKWVSLMADYTRSSLKSELNFLVPQTLQPARSVYRDSAHVASSLLDLKIPHIGAGSASLGLGGSLYVSTGSRASDYYQPLGRLTIPLHRKASVFGEWRWYNYAEQFYRYEGFRTHHFVLGLRLAM
ncbi:MAG: hypothetical protein IT159_01830 [Bryobacterales bacterium]|nr:hypothetical protein [Bryobacterales bacterium]